MKLPECPYGINGKCPEVMRLEDEIKQIKTVTSNNTRILYILVGICAATLGVVII